MRTRLMIFCFLMLPVAACDGSLTAADCEPLTTQASCEKKGCTFVHINRAIMDGRLCVAAERRPGCLAAGESVNNVMGAVCRDLPGGGFEFVMFGAARPADGWENCGGDIFNMCDVPVTTCEGKTDRVSCEASYCYWAEPVRVGTIDAESMCVGWEAQTVGMCLTPEPYMTYFEGANDFDFYTQGERFFSIEPVEGARRVLAFTVSRSARFASGSAAAPDFWRECSSAGDAPCNCP